MLMSGNLTWPVKSRRLGQIFVGVNNQDKSDCAPEPRGALLSQNDLVERVMGIEPTLFAWEARVLPLNDTRVVLKTQRCAKASVMALPTESK